MRAAADKAIGLDPLLPEAHTALGMVYGRDGQWKESEKCFRRAVEIDPGSSQSHVYFAAFLLQPLGRTQEAVEQVRAAERSDPLSPDVQARLGIALILAGRFDEAIVHCENQPDDFWAKPQCFGRARLGQGRITEAIQILETAFNRGVSPSSEVWGYLGHAYARAGRTDDAEKLAASTPAVNPLNRALIFAGLGDKVRTFEALDRVAAAGPIRIGRALIAPEFALLRGDSRLKALRKKVGLPE